MRARKKTAAPLPDVLQARAPGPAPAVDGLVFVPGPEDAGLRLDVFLAGVLAGRGLSREKIKQCIKDGRVSLDGEPCSSPRTPVRPGCRVAVGVPEAVSRLTPEEGELTVLYQDRFLAVINKPAGLTVHPCPSCPQGTLAHRLAARFPSLAAMEGFRPGIVHRLDKDTSGLLLAALSEQSRLALAALFAGREVRKEYLALVSGVPNPAEGGIDQPIGRHPQNKVKMAVVKGGRPAQSAWRTLYADPDGRFSLLAVRIFTGRTHQIRVHMAHLGHPLLGDALYGCRTLDGLCRPARQMLHAWRLAFDHPFADALEKNGQPAPGREEGPALSFTCPPPEDFMHALLGLSRRMRRVVVTGSPGCGKSALLGLLKEAGLPVFSADETVRRLYEPGGDGHTALLARFGPRFAPDARAPVDKAALGAAMTDDPALRREVEELLHPMVRHRLEAFWREWELAGADMAAAEIPLFLEAGFRGRGEKNKAASRAGGRDAAEPSLPVILVGVRCSFGQRAERLRKNRGWSQEWIARVESWQWPEAEKMRACDHVVDNTASPEDLRVNVRELLRKLAEEQKAEEQARRELFSGLWTGRGEP